MLQITETDRDRIVRNLDMMRAHCNAITRILEHEIAAANAIHAGIADAIMILDNLRPVDEGHDGCVCQDKEPGALFDALMSLDEALNSVDYSYRPK